MKICLITFQYPPMLNGGVGTAIHRISRNLSAVGEDIHVVAPGELDLEDRIVPVKEAGVTIHRTFPGLGNHFGSPDQLRLIGEYVTKLHDDVGFDLLHGVFLFPAGHLACILSKRLGIPAIVSIRGSDIELMRFNPAFFGTVRWVLENSQMTTSVATSLLDNARQIADIARSRVIQNAFDPEIFDHRPIGQALADAHRAGKRGLLDRLIPGRSMSLTPTDFLERLEKEKSKGKLIIGTSSIIRPQKGFPTLVDSFVGLLKRNPNLLLFVVGDFADPEDRNKWHTRFKQAGFKDRLFLTGRVPHRLVLGWMKLMDVFVLPSIYEGSPNALLEAMYCEIPVVSTAVDGVDDILSDGENGLLFPVGDSAALTDILARLTADPALRTDLGKAGRRTVEDSFSPESETRIWLETYRSTLPLNGIPSSTGCFLKSLKTGRENLSRPSELHSTTSARRGPTPDYESRPIWPQRPTKQVKRSRKRR